MNTVRHVLLSLLVLGVAAAAHGQSTEKKPSEDPFVQNRTEKKAAKKEYKGHQISKEQYNQERKDANDQLKASGEKPTGTGNLEVPEAGKAKGSSK